MTEAQLQEQVAAYIRFQYPDTMFHSDFGSGIKLTPGQAIKQKRQNGGRRAWPDMFIAQSRCQYNPIADVWDHGLFIELKKNGTRLQKKDGSWASEHLEEQAKVLQGLRERGYKAEFAVGFDEAKNLIDNYLGVNDK